MGVFSACLLLFKSSFLLCKEVSLTLIFLGLCPLHHFLLHFLAQSLHDPNIVNSVASESLLKLVREDQDVVFENNVFKTFHFVKRVLILFFLQVFTTFTTSCCVFIVIIVVFRALFLILARALVSSYLVFFPIVPRFHFYLFGQSQKSWL